MIAALTLLPALLGFIGPRVMSRRQQTSLADDGPRIVGAGTQGVLAALGRLHPDADRSFRQSLALLVIVLLALPFFSLRLGSSDQGNDPVGTTTRTAYDLLAKGFGPGFNGPAAAGRRDRSRPTGHPGPRSPGRRGGGPTRRGQGHTGRGPAGQGRQRRSP